MKNLELSPGPVAPCQRRWCSMPAQTPTTSSTSTTAWGHSCWTLTTASPAFWRMSGTEAETFPWRFAQISWNILELKINLQAIAPHFPFPVVPQFLLYSLPPAVQKYMKPIFTEESYLELQRKQKKSFNTQQLTAFRLLFAWRDKLARQEDESTG